MGQYIGYSLGAENTEELIGADQIDKMTAEEALSDATLRSQNIALGIKAINAALKSTTPDVAGKLQTLANDVDSLRIRMNTYFKSLPDQNSLFKMTAGEWAIALTSLPPLAIIKSIWGKDPINKNGHLMLRQIVIFQKELQGYCTRFYNLTGKKVSGCTMLPDPRPRPDEEKPEDRALDFLWGTVKVGAVVLGGWLLYKYLDKQSRYPSNKLPRYAGGRRRRR